jgi:hypothetical protein
MSWLRRNVTTVDCLVALLVIAVLVVYSLIRFYGWPFGD